MSESVQYRDEDWLREQYWERRRSASEIGDECGVSKVTILNWMDKHGIERRDTGGSRQISNDELLLELRAGAEALGDAPTIQEMKVYGAYSERPYIDRFGSWRGALEAAGIDPDTGEIVKSDVEVFGDDE